MVFLRVAQLAVAVATQHSAFIAVGATRQMMELQATPIIFAAEEASRDVAAQALQSLLLAEFLLEFVSHLTVPFFNRRSCKFARRAPRPRRAGGRGCWVASLANKAYHSCRSPTRRRTAAGWMDRWCAGTPSRRPCSGPPARTPHSPHGDLVRPASAEDLHLARSAVVFHHPAPAFFLDHSRLGGVGAQTLRSHMRRSSGGFEGLTPAHLLDPRL